MTEEEITDFIINSIIDDYYDLGKKSNMTDAQIEELIQATSQTIVHIGTNIYKKMKEKNLLQLLH